MKLPRGVSAGQLLRVLQRFGYEIARQKGSHIRLQHPGRRSTPSPSHSTIL